MSIHQNAGKLTALSLLLGFVLFVFAGPSYAGMMPPYTAISQDGSTVVGYDMDTDVAFSLRDGVVTTLGTLGGDFSYALAVSADGSVVVGNSRTDTDKYHAFRWTGGTMTDLGTLGGDYSYASAVSADGSVVVGDSDLGADKDHAFRWVDGTMTDLGTFGGDYSSAYAVSADGSVVVGSADMEDDYSHAFRWVDGTITDLGTLGGNYSSGRFVSADGLVVAGNSDTDTDEHHAFRWVDGAMTDLGTLGGDYSRVYDLSADGSVVVGESNIDTDEYHAFRWVDGTMTDLGSFGGDYSYANAVSADGSVVVGAAEDADGDRVAFRWDSKTGMLSVADWLDDDVSLDGWELTSAYDVSGDGSVVIGYGYDPEGDSAGWMASKRALINPVQWLSTVSGAQQVFHTGAQLSSLVMSGAHHRPLMSYDQIGKGSGFWLTGDLAEFNDGRDVTSGSAEIGMYNDYADGRIRAGLGLGYSGQRENLSLAGSTDLDGKYLIGEINWLPIPDTTLIASVTASLGFWDAEVNRGYLNGADVDMSSGNTDIQSSAVRLKLDWQDAVRLGPVRIDPYAGLTFTHTRVDGYTESDGGVPAQFDTQKHDAQELRVGVAGMMPLSEAVQLRLTVEGVKRFDDDGPALTGQDVGGFGISFDIPGDDIRQTWMRGGAEIDYTISETAMLSVSVNSASEGQDADLSGALSFRKSF